MCGSDCCFLSCIKLAQEIGKVNWHSCHFKNFPCFFVIHTVEDFNVVNEAELDFFFLIFPCFFYDPVDAGNLISDSCAFLKFTCISGSSWFTSWWSLLSITLLACEMSLFSSLNIFLALTVFVIGMKTDLFQSCGHCWLSHICWHIDCNTLSASSIRIWNNWAGIPSPPLELFIVKLPKAHLTFHSRTSDYKWVSTPSYLSRSLPFLSFIEPIFV